MGILLMRPHKVIHKVIHFKFGRLIPYAWKMISLCSVVGCYRWPNAGVSVGSRDDEIRVICVLDDGVAIVLRSHVGRMTTYVAGPMLDVCTTLADMVVIGDSSSWNLVHCARPLKSSQAYCHVAGEH